MKTRIITSAVGLCVLAIVLSLFNTIVLDLVLSVICLMAVHEAFCAFGFTGKQIYLFAPFVPFVVLIMMSHNAAARSGVLLAAFAFVLYLCICVIWQHRTVDVGKLGGFLFLSSVVVLCFYCLIELKRMLPAEKYHNDAIFFVLLILCYAWGGDSAAYFAGRFFGKHKLAPTVSPNKTIEGAIGGVCGSVVLGVLATFIYHGTLPEAVTFGGQSIGGAIYFIVAIVGVIASVLGILGDLFASAVKRQVGIKDYGRIFPGHGGILDRFDSVMFIAPLVTIVVQWVFYEYLV